VVTVGAQEDVAQRKRPEDERPQRLTIEVYGDEEITLVRHMRSAAALRGERVREWLLRAIRAQLEREGRSEQP
jgi:hypothetical protein